MISVSFSKDIVDLIKLSLFPDQNLRLSLLDGAHTHYRAIQCSKVTDTNKSMSFVFFYHMRSPGTFNIIITINIVPDT